MQEIKNQETLFNEALKALYPDIEEQNNVISNLMNANLDFTTTTRNSFDNNDNREGVAEKKGPMNFIKDFFSMVPVGNNFELDVYGSTARNLLTKLYDPTIPIEVRLEKQKEIANSLRELEAPFKEYLEKEKVAELLNQGQELSKENYYQIQRLAMIKEMSQLKQLPQNHKIEAVHALANLVYSYDLLDKKPQKSGINVRFMERVYTEDDDYLLPIEPLKPISGYEDFGFKTLESSLIDEFIEKFSNKSIEYEEWDESMDGYPEIMFHSLDEVDMKEMTDNYISRLGLQSDYTSLERNEYIREYIEDLSSDRGSDIDSDETLDWQEQLARNFDRGYKKTLSKLYPDSENQKQMKDIIESLDTSDLADVTSIGSPKNVIKEFLSKLSLDTTEDLDLYGSTAKQLISQLHDSDISVEDRRSMLTGIATALGDCSTPVRDYLMAKNVAELLKSEKNGTSLSPKEEHIIERQALIEDMGKIGSLNKLDVKGDTIESINTLANLVYSQKHVEKFFKDNKGRIKPDAEQKFNEFKSKINVTHERNLPSTSKNIEFGFKTLKTGLFDEFITKYTKEAEDKSVRILNEEKLNEITEKYKEKALEPNNNLLETTRYQYYGMYEKEIKGLINNSDLINNTDQAALKLLDEISEKQTYFKNLLEKITTEESIKQTYTDFLSEQESKINNFLSVPNTQNVQAGAGGTTEPISLQQLELIENPVINNGNPPVSAQSKTAGQGPVSTSSESQSQPQAGSTENRDHHMAITQTETERGKTGELLQKTPPQNQPQAAGQGPLSTSSGSQSQTQTAGGENNSLFRMTLPQNQPQAAGQGPLSTSSGSQPQTQTAGVGIESDPLAPPPTKRPRH
ncbi:hypothetical protein [Chryseobacterium candidae]|uniref:Uncharacterized protein n=1 Tax=Chryseobacterium candidae TaxID=1978493 RepID=A0ABY2R5C7_9FLAO|nr:hypothetical protein [Chryseobacterium candidae]THV57576.1 hypothetical protein EK417_16310 [Chryseobacterium candidae]